MIFIGEIRDSIFVVFSVSNILCDKQPFRL
jgi:hypothetical protein